MATIGPYTGLTFTPTREVPDMFLTLDGNIFGWGPVQGFDEPGPQFNFTIGELSSDGNWYKAGTNAMISKERLKSYIAVGILKIAMDDDMKKPEENRFEPSVSRLETID
jgi:hypothetical protein